MTIRAKLTVLAITDHHWNRDAKTVRLECMYDSSIPEDQRFYAATPSGHFEMLVNNPAALEQLTLGKSFYVDLTPVPDEPK